MQRIEHKRGDTFAPTAQYSEADGSSASLDGYEIRSELRDRAGNLVHRFEITVNDAASGKYAFTPVDTSAWPLGELQMDIEYRVDGVRISTETLLIAVGTRVTQGT